MVCAEIPDPRLSLLPERIRARIVVSPDTGCWVWTGGVSQGRGGGYGRVSMHGQTCTVHIVLWRLLVQPYLRRGLQLDHECENRRCCLPDHLRPRTQSMNIRLANQRRSRRALECTT